MSKAAAKPRPSWRCLCAGSTCRLACTRCSAARFQDALCRARSSEPAHARPRLQAAAQAEPGGRARAQEEDQAELYGCLRVIFQRGACFGGGLFALAASVMTDLIHHDPLCFRALDDAGLPQAFLDAVTVRRAEPAALFPNPNLPCLPPPSRHLSGRPALPGRSPGCGRGAPRQGPRLPPSRAICPGAAHRLRAALGAAALRQQGRGGRACASAITRVPVCARQAGVLPSGEAVCCVPNTLVALCLNTGGLARVRASRALRCFVPIFTSRQYLRALQVSAAAPGRARACRGSRERGVHASGRG